MDTIVIIQARMGSSRLPGKVLMDLGKHDILSYVTERCKKISNADLVIVATSNLPGDDKIEEWCNEKQIECYRGSESDVLQRFVDIADKYKPKYIVRVTADCPFVDYEMTIEMIDLIKQTNMDIIDVTEDLPRGIVTEVFTYDLLKKVHEKGKEARHREHVTYFAYEFMDLFKRTEYFVSEDLKFPQFRITLDTIEDYELIKKVVESLNNIDVSTRDVIEFLKNNHEVARINSHIEQKPVV